MTLNEAKKILKSKNMYFLKESSAFGTYDEYVAKLSDLWAEEFDETDEMTLDELLFDQSYADIVQNCYDTDTDPTDAIEELKQAFENAGEIDSDDDYEPDDESDEIDKIDNADDTEFVPEYEYETKDEAVPADDYEFDEAKEYLRSHGYTINENSDLLTESWFNNTDMPNSGEFVSLMNSLASAKSKRRTGSRVRGSYMTPSRRNSFYRAMSEFLPAVERASSRAGQKLRQEMELLQDENWYRFVQDKNPDMSMEEIRGFFGHAELGDDETLTPEEREERDAARRRAEEEERQRQEAEERERRRRENPEPEDLVRDADFEEQPEDVVTTRRVTRHRLRTGQREFTDHYRIPVATIKINIDTTNDPESLQEAEEIVNTIKETLRMRYEGDPGMFQHCKVDAAEVDVDSDEGPKKEYHVVITMPGEIKEEIAKVVKDEMEDAFTFVTSEHPDDSVYEFDTSGTREESYTDEYEYDEPVVQRRRLRPQTTATRRVRQMPKWRVHYTLADENGNDTHRVRMVVVQAPTAEDAKNKVENPEDIDSAYATGVFAVTNVDPV